MTTNGRFIVSFGRGCLRAHGTSSLEQVIRPSSIPLTKHFRTAKVKRILRKYKYPPNQQDAAVDLVLQQAQSLSEDWA